MIALALISLLNLPAGAAEVTRVEVDGASVVAVVPAGLYGVGYNGWGDITSEQAVGHLSSVGVTHCRIDADLSLLCGETPGALDLDYVTPRDRGLGFAARVQKIIDNGWVPIIALSTSHALPRWFHGEPTAGGGRPWVSFDLDGTPAEEGRSDQYGVLARVTHDLTLAMAQRGLSGLMWETIYEIGHTMPMADIHYHAARGIHSADPEARLMGPATWPGWTVTERFLKPLASKYGLDLLDFVSVHWYGSNEHGLWDLGYKPGQDIITMADRAYLDCLMETTPRFADWCRELRSLLDSPQYNPAGRHIGIAYTEYDANAQSPYGRNPENPDWPRYRADADCYVNTNWFGGVWCASVLCNLAACGGVDIALKFNTRQYYGLVDNAPEDGYFRQPVWFAWKLLQTAGGLVPGARMLETKVDGPTDSAAEHLKGRDTPWVEAYAVHDPRGVRVVLVNRSQDEQRVELALPDWRHDLLYRRYLYSKERLAPFIGPRPGDKGEGRFQGAPDDSFNEQVLLPVDEIVLSAVSTEVTCPPVSITVLRPAPRGR